jgi:hypothetical protein
MVEARFFFLSFLDHFRISEKFRSNVAAEKKKSKTFFQLNWNFLEKMNDLDYLLPIKVSSPLEQQNFFQKKT